MANPTKNILIEACRAILNPLASILLRSGVTWKEFCDVAKLAFVSVAIIEFGIRGRPTNTSRVSILTGIDRKEVKRLRTLLEDSEESTIKSKSTDATRLLSGWHQDPLYLDEHGRPLELPISGPAPSFLELFNQFGGDTPEQTMRRELKNAGAIKLTDQDTVVVQMRYFKPQALSEENLVNFGVHLGSHAQTLRNNLIQTKKYEARFEGAAAETAIDPRHAKEFNDFLNQRGQQFLEEVDDWLAQKRLEGEPATQTIKLGVGVYAIDSSKEQRTTI